MNNDGSQGEDVTQTASNADAAVETDTTGTSSSENQTDQKPNESSRAEDTKGTDSKYVPYERFSEVNTKARELEAKIAELEGRLNKPTESVPQDPQKEAVKEALKPILAELGFVSKQELSQIEEDKALEAEISGLEKKFDGTDGRPKFVRDDVIKFALDNKIGSVEAAYKLKHDKELTNWAIEKALMGSKGVKAETSNGSGSSEVGTSSDDLKEAIKDGNKTALRTFLKRVAQTSLK